VILPKLFSSFFQGRDRIRENIEKEKLEVSRSLDSIIRSAPAAEIFMEIFQPPSHDFSLRSKYYLIIPCGFVP
jgi:hypothetical protein